MDWETAIAGGPRDFLDLIQALAGRDPKPETVELLQGVTQIARKGDSFELTRADQSVLQLAPDSDRGAKWLEGWSKIESTAQEDFGDTAGSFIRNISAITKRGSRIEIDRSGPSELMVDLKTLIKKKLPIPIRLKSARIGKVSLQVDSRGSHPALKDIEGIRVYVSTAAIVLPLDLKEFSKWKNGDGKKMIFFAIKNPVPAPVRSFLGIPPNIPFTFALPRKHDNTNDPSETSQQAPDVNTPQDLIH